MFWIVQGNLKNDEGLNKLISVLRDDNYQHQLVRTIPFSNIIVDVDLDISQYDEGNIPHLNIQNEANMVTMGSYSLALTAKEKGWVPGAFVNENYEFNKWVSGWGKDHLLNGDAIEDSVANIIDKIPDNAQKFFARPSEDTKSFNGTVFERENLIYWLKQVANSNDRFGLGADTSVIVASEKSIEAEYRLFIVDGKVVTGSLYRVNGVVVTSEQIDQKAIDYAYSMLDIWQPDRAFVLDVALTDNGPKIIEINNINSSGFYKADISKIVESIDAMKF
jgi:hypothetical protein